MPTTVKIHMPELTQGTLGEDSGHDLRLSKSSDQSALNGGGDNLLWAGNGWLTATVAEEWSEVLAAVVIDSNGYAVRDGWLAVGETVVRDSFPTLTVTENQWLSGIYDAIFPADPEVSPIVILPSDPDRVTAWAVCLGLDGQAQAGIVVTYILQSAPPRDAGKILNGSTTGSETSAANGLVQFEGLLPGATYYFTCGHTQVSCTIPLDADPEAGYQLPSFVKT